MRSDLRSEIPVMPLNVDILTSKQINRHHWIMFFMSRGTCVVLNDPRKQIKPQFRGLKTLTAILSTRPSSADISYHNLIR